LLGTLPDVLRSLGAAMNVTLLAPSNQALGAFLNSTAGRALATNSEAVTALLQYHVLNGSYSAETVTNTSAFIPTSLTDEAYTNVTGGQRVEVVRVRDNVTFYSGLLQNSSVVQADVAFTGGLIHVIDHILTIPGNVSSTLVEAGLSSLYGALNATNLLNTVNGLRDVTIFAPNNSAFRAIGSALSNASTEELTSLLTYHAVNGSLPLYSSDLANGTSLQTINGANVTIHLGRNGTVFVNGARVIKPNVLVAGGVVHVIDQVLNPSATEGPAATATAGTGAFTGASSATDEPFTSGVATVTSSIGGGPATATSSSSKAAAAGPMMTGAVGAAALFGAGAAWVGNM